MSYRKINVYDLDGCLVDSSHRYRNKSDGTIDLDYWIANRTPENIALDKTLPLAWSYADAILHPEIYVIICTSRVETEHDKNYIANNLGLPNKLIMRPVGNMDGDGILKRRQLQRVFNLRQFQNLPRTLWEDNQKNIEALKDLFTNYIFIKSKIGN